MTLHNVLTQKHYVLYVNNVHNGLIEITLDDVEPCNGDSTRSVQSYNDTTCSVGTMTLRTELAL